MSHPREAPVEPLEAIVPSDVALRLAGWLAEVSAEAALTTAPSESPAADEPPSEDGR